LSHLRCVICVIRLVMPYRDTPFLNNNFYHIFNRGVEKRETFSSKRDYERFLQTVYYYQFGGPKPKFSTYTRFRLKNFNENPKIVEINCYCLMPNHFHLLVKQTRDSGIHEFMTKLLNSYTKYYNTKHDRVGHLFQGQFKAVNIKNEYQLLQVSRYIHLNPYVSDLTREYEAYPYSSYSEYLTPPANPTITIVNPVLSGFKNPKDYKDFVKDYEGYALEVEKVKHLLLDI